MKSAAIVNTVRVTDFLNLDNARKKSVSLSLLTTHALTTKEVERLGRRLNRLWDAKERRRGIASLRERIVERKNVELTAVQEFEI